MEELLFNEIFEEWKAKELAFHKQQKRRYLHFDEKIAFPTRVQFFRTYLSNAKINVPKHSFYPFVKSDIITPRIKVEKQDGKKRIVYRNKVRPIAYASHFDSFLYSWYSTLLTNLYIKKIPDWGIEDCVLAYLKKNRCNIDFAKEVFDYIKNFGECIVLAFDISSFFDGLDHEILKAAWCKVLESDRLPKDHWAVFKTLTNYSFVEKNDIEMVFPRPLERGYKFERFCSPKEYREYIRGDKLIQLNPFYNKVCSSKNFGKQCGIPQGSPISACLSNIYMIDFDRSINNYAKESNSFYRRYCDDIIIVCPTQMKEFWEEAIQSELKRFELVVNPQKTEISYFRLDENNELKCSNSKGDKSRMQYLGFEFNGKEVFIRSSSLSRHARRRNLKIEKAVKNAYEFRKDGESIRVYRKGLYKALTELGNRNFIRYAIRAGEHIFDSESIRKQYKGSIKKVDKTIQRKIEKEERKIQLILSKKNPIVSTPVN